MDAFYYSRISLFRAVYLCDLLSELPTPKIDRDNEAAGRKRPATGPIFEAFTPPPKKKLSLSQTEQVPVITISSESD